MGVLAVATGCGSSETGAPSSLPATPAPGANHSGGGSDSGAASSGVATPPPSATNSGSGGGALPPGEGAPAPVASNSGNAGGAPSSVDPAPAAPVRASYHVPVPVELEPYSDFELNDVRLRQHGDEWELDYSLPTLLVGSNQRVSFRGVRTAEGQYELSGDSGRVSCRDAGEQLRCDETLSQVQFDEQKLERALAALPADESAARRAVAVRFSDDPIGVLTFPR